MLTHPIKIRIGEIDALRGVAIILMVIFHIIVDLADFFDYPLQYLSGFWYYEGKMSAILFILLAGLSATLSHSAIYHGLSLLAWGMALTVASWLFAPLLYIRFGILHLLGTSLLTWPLIHKQKPGTLLLLAISSIALGPYVAKQAVSSSWLLPLGFMPPGFTSMDYYPFFPWYGIFLLGTVVGKTFYAKPVSLIPWLKLPKALTGMGRYSLAIYLIHQPIILAVLYLFH